MKDLYSGFWDGPHATPKESDSGPIYLGIKNISKDGQLDFSDVRHISEEDYPIWIQRVEPKPGDIVFTYEATLHRYAIIPVGFRGCLGRRLALLRLNPSVVDTHFLFYYFFGNEWRKTVSKYMILGSTVDRIPIIYFPNFEVYLPPISTQRKIAAVLSAYDDLIENNTRRIRILEQMAQAVYREWFVHLRFPGHDGMRMVGGMPEGWEEVKVEDIVTLFRGRSYGSNDLAEEGGLPFLNLKCLERDGGFRHNGIKRYKGVFKEGQTAKSGDIIMALTDMTQERRIIARAARVPDMGEDIFVMSMDLVKLSPKFSKSQIAVIGESE